MYPGWCPLGNINSFCKRFKIEDVMRIQGASVQIHGDDLWEISKVFKKTLDWIQDAVRIRRLFSFKIQSDDLVGNINSSLFRNIQDVVFFF